MDVKQLKKLADACRKAGIKHFKNAEFEFTLSDDTAPISNYKRKKVAEAPSTADSPANKPFVTDSLTEDELLFWSTGVDPTAEGN